MYTYILNGLLCVYLLILCSVSLVGAVDASAKKKTSTEKVSTPEKKKPLKKAPVEKPKPNEDIFQEMNKKPVVYRSRRLGTQALKDCLYDKAIEFYRQYQREAVNDPPALKDAYQCLISALTKADRPVEARKYLKELKKKFPGFHKIRMTLYEADILMTEGKYALAETILEKILPSIPKKNTLYFQALAGLGFSLVKRQRWAKATDVYSTLQTSGQGTKWDFKAFKWKVLAMLEQGELKAAEAELTGRHCPPDSSEFMVVQLLKVYLLAKQKKYDDAVKIYEKYVNKEIQNSECVLEHTIVYMLAMLYFQHRDYKNALLFLNQSFMISSYAKQREIVLYTIIESYEKLKERKKAIIAAQRFLKYYPESARRFSIQTKLARLFHELGDNKNALAEYNKLIHSSADKKYRLNAAKAAVIILEKLKRLPEVKSKLEFIVANTADPVLKHETEYKLALILFKEKNYGDAAKKFLVLADHSREWREEALEKSIQALYNHKDYKQAVLLARKFLKEYPTGKDRKDVIFLYAFALKKNGDWDKAQKEFADFAKNYPNNEAAPDALFESGNISFEKCDFITAIRTFSELIQTYPSHELTPSAIYKRLYARYFEGQNKEAIEDASFLMERYAGYPHTVHAMFWLADYYRENQEYKKAEKILRTIYTKSENNKENAARALFENAFVHYKAQNPKQALNYIDELLNRFPDNQRVSDGLFLKSEIFSSLGDYKNAITFYEKAAARRPESQLETSCWGRLGDCYFALSSQQTNGDVSKVLMKSAEYYKKIMKKKGLSPFLRGQTLYKLGKCYELLGRMDMALSTYMELILNFEMDENDHHIQSLWLVKAALRAVDINLKKNSPQAARNAIKIYRKLIALRIQPVEDYKKRIKVIRSKFRL